MDPVCYFARVTAATSINQCNDIFCLFSMCKPLVHVVCLHPCIYLCGCAPLLPDWFHISGPKWAQFLSK